MSLLLRTNWLWVRIPLLSLKGYLRYKTILCHKAAWFVINEFFYLKKKSCFVLEMSRFLCFCETCRLQNFWRHHKSCCIMQVTLIYAYFFWILSPIKMKFGQMLVCCMTSISNMFLAGNWKLENECWRLETSSRLFYDFIKIPTQ